MIAIVGTRLQELLSYLGFTLSVSAALTVASLFVLRRREGPAAVPVPGYPWVPGLFVAATLVFARARRCAPAGGAPRGFGHDRARRDGMVDHRAATPALARTLHRRSP